MLITFRSIMTGLKVILRASEIEPCKLKHVYVGSKIEGFEVIKISFKKG